MKKLLTLLMLLTLGMSNLWAQEEYTISSEFTPTENQKEKTTNITFVYNNSGWSATDATKGSKGSQYGNGSVSNGIPQSGNFWSFTTAKAGSMTITAYFDTNNEGKYFYVYKADGTKVAEIVSNATKGEKTTAAFNIETGTTYYVYSYGTSSIYFKKFSFTPAAPVFSSMEVNTDDIYYEGTTSQVSTSFQRVSDTSKKLRIKLNLKDQNGDDFALDNAYKTTGYFTVTKKSGDDVFTLGSYSVEYLAQAARVYIKIPVAASGTEELIFTYTNGTSFSCSQSFTVTDPASEEGTANFTLNTSSPTLTVNGVTLSGGSGNNDGYSFDANGVLTVTAPANKVITGMTITYSADQADRTGGTITVNSGTYSRTGDTGTWTGSATPVTLTMSNKARITAMTVTFADEPTAVTPTMGIKVNDTLAEDSPFAVTTGSQVTLSSVFNNGAVDASNFSVVYSILNVDGEANAASIVNGNTLNVGHIVGQFQIQAVATSNSATYNNTSKTITIQVNNSFGNGTSQDLFEVTNFDYATVTNGTNAADNKLDRTLKGFDFTFSGFNVVGDDITEAAGEGVKYNNDGLIILRTSGSNRGRIGINENNQGKCTIYKMDVTYTSNKDAQVLTNAVAGDWEITHLPVATSEKTVTIGLGRSFAQIQLWDADADTYVKIKSVKLYYDAGSLDQTLVTPALTVSTSTTGGAVGSDIEEPIISETSPKTLSLTGLTYSSSNTGVATVDASGNVTAVANGEAVITITRPATTYFNEATTSYTVIVTSGSIYEKWNFNTLDVTNTIDAGWAQPASKTYYENQFTADKAVVADYTPASTSQLYELQFRRDGNALAAGNIRLYTDHMYFTNSKVVVRVPVTEGQKVYVTFDGGNGETVTGFSFTNATFDDDPSATSITTDATKITATLTATADGYVDLSTLKSKVNLYQIALGAADTKQNLTTFRSMGGQTYAYDKSSTTTFNHTVTFQPDGALVKGTDESHITVTSSDASVLDVSTTTIGISEGTVNRFVINGIKVIGGGTATLTVNFTGNDNYKPASFTTSEFAVTAPQAFDMTVANLNIQNSQRAVIMPTITNASGEAIGFDDSGNVIVLDEDATIDYDSYFDFTYEISSNDAGLSLNPDDNSIVVSAKGDSYVGKSATVTVTAKPKTEPTDYSGKFTNASVTKTLTVTITERAQELYVDFLTSRGGTQKVAGTSDEVTAGKAAYTYTLDGSTTVISSYPSGRVFYMQVNDAGKAAGVEEIWFSYNNGSVKNVTPTKTGKNDYGKKQYLYNTEHGMVPVYGEAGDAIYVNVQCVKVASVDEKGNKTYETLGSVIPVKFVIAASTDRPAKVTFDPVSDGTVHRSTAQTVVANGTEGNTVYAKFSSTGTNYTLEGLVNEPNVYSATTSVGVISTEVAARKITGAQIYAKAANELYISDKNTSTYMYQYATTLALSQYAYTIDLDNSSEVAAFTEPTLIATYYDKIQKKAIDASSGEGITVTYTIEPRNGAESTINASTGDVTLGDKSGTVVVTASYHNTNNYTVNKRTYTMEDKTIQYTIYLVKSTEHIPTITPDSKKFYPTQTVKVAADKEWVTYYTKDGSDPKSSGTRLTLEAGKSATFTVDATTTVKAVAYDGTSQWSPVVSETYTLGEQVLPPYFMPGAADQTYYYYTPTLIVELLTNTAGASIYYTTDGTVPYMEGHTTKMYDGLERITLEDKGTTIIRAFAYKDGIQSEVKSATYVYSNNMNKPTVTNVTDSKTYNDGDTDQVVDPTDEITITSDIDVPAGYTKVIYYTLDGSEPTTETGIKYTGPINILTDVTLKAIVVLVDEDDEETSSQATTVSFKVPTSGLHVWEAVGETTPDGKMLAADGFVISTEAGLKVANTGSKVNLKSLSTTDGGSSSYTYAQKYITATFGGFDAVNWESYTISDNSLGTPLDGVGQFSMRSTNDALDENGNFVSHTNTVDTEDNSQTPKSIQSKTTHERTFKVPAQGAFVRFEPERDGQLTIWALQQGGVHFNEDVRLCDKFVRRRPVYFIDEQGKSQVAVSATSSARLSNNWTAIINNYAANGKEGFTPYNGSQNGVVNSLYTQDESENIYNMYMNYFTTNHIAIGDEIAPFPIHTSSTGVITEKSGQSSDSNYDMTGYVLASGGYVKYVFNVKAGKTYYFFGHRTKIGIRGFKFDATEDDDAVAARQQVTINADEKVATDFITGNINTTKPLKVTLNRNFSANTYTTLVLPFSVSERQLEEAFSNGTSSFDDAVDVIHFNGITGGNTINMYRHWYKMIVAGTPVMIKPKKAVSSVTFDGVRIETADVDELTGEDETFTMMGTYVWLPAETGLKQNDYYVSTAGDFKRLTSTSSAMKATRTWLRPKDGEAKELFVNISSFDDEIPNEEDTDEIRAIFNDNTWSSSSNSVYNLKGQKVSNGSFRNLPKGVYIVNGKKVIID
ncbi:MAG: chitobiase/beta-hexosaminidase C-terminal domain-containing protein [Paludibacteraceae bacterium]|nr:chitobiase/beta-hexosaminidase C-terminal domain-containing protein [Paludibacteraceae bacterium]